MTAADPVASRLLDRSGVCGARRGTLSQREKVTGRAFDRQIGSTKRGDRYADCRIRTGFALDSHSCFATVDREWSSGESRLRIALGQRYCRSKEAGPWRSTDDFSARCLPPKATQPPASARRPGFSDRRSRGPPGRAPRSARSSASGGRARGGVGGNIVAPTPLVLGSGLITSSRR